MLFSFKSCFLNLTGKDRGADYSRESLVQHRKSLACAQGWIFFGLVETSLTVNDSWVNCLGDLYLHFKVKSVPTFMSWRFLFPFGVIDRLHSQAVKRF